MHLAQETLNLLGINPLQPFKIKEGDQYKKDINGEDQIYIIDEELYMYSYNKHKEEYRSLSTSASLIFSLLQDTNITIHKEITITNEDKIAIEYFKLIGYQYIAKDRNGSIWGYKTKPIKYLRDQCWRNPNGPGDMLQCRYNISCISWEDNEPYYIGE